MAAADHLRVPRQHGLFLHHGIDLGDGSVAHYLEGREILRSPLAEFSRGQEVSVVSHDQASPAGVTLRRAMSRIGEQNYNLLFNNCEHFANWCKTGRHRSGQVEDWLHTGSLGALALGQLMPAALLTGLGLLLRKGLIDEASKERARQGLVQLQRLRQTLLEKLESTLEQAEVWLKGMPGQGADDRLDRRGRQLLLTGRTIADELAAVEDLETRIRTLLETNPET
ncbi:lecithin retinol acyltransferase family protein [Synechococcus sp. PROS-7-1]|uniref:lecithin retinol acyltransferase family protein n=1 Tax=Synechococcus sp. PROS-7-1 TaxID=1442556 RepID=UPI001646969D|nr:lecithin retinol acyltransferase family protein [Synechococcus sp. PROS-7-1]QNI83904.1 lecithin retinol acyltransferase family protein [Synechococcus sp. PROS-7-1]